MQKLAAKLAPATGVRAVGIVLGWPFLKKEVEESLKSMERLKSLIVLSLQRDFMSVDDDFIRLILF
jgi:hypothetical protein